MNQLNTNHGNLNTAHLNRMMATIYRALDEHPRTIAIRADLRLPGGNHEFHIDTDSPCCFPRDDKSMISRFFSSLDAKIEADLNKKRRDGKRVHPHTLRYAWAREYGEFGKPHYHVFILLNRDNYFTLGDYNAAYGSLASLIRQAWTSALNIDEVAFRNLVHFPESPTYRLGRHTESVKSNFIYRVSYFAKCKTKRYQRERRSFGCSQR